MIFIYINLKFFMTTQMSTVFMEWRQEYHQNGMPNYFCGPHLL